MPPHGIFSSSIIPDQYKRKEKTCTEMQGHDSLPHLLYRRKRSLVPPYASPVHSNTASHLRGFVVLTNSSHSFNITAEWLVLQIFSQVSSNISSIRYNLPFKSRITSNQKNKIMFSLLGHADRFIHLSIYDFIILTWNVYLHTLSIENSWKKNNMIGSIKPHIPTTSTNFDLQTFFIAWCQNYT